MKQRRTLVLALVLLALGACSKPPKPTLTDPTRQPADVLDYTVGDLDTWESISEAFFGDASRAGRIAGYNGSALALAPRPGTQVAIRVLDDELERVTAVADARGSYNAGVEAMQEQGGDDEAERAFKRVLDRAPWFVDARYNLGLVQLRQGRPAAAQKNLAEVVKARPADAEAWYALAASSFHAGDYATALAPLDQALSLDPTMLRASWTRALCLQRMGRGPEAIEAWHDYLELDPTSAWADQARDHLAELGT